MRQLYEVADFVRAARRRLRFGDLSRAPIRILRLALQGDYAECDWMTRPPDLWDLNMSQPSRDESASRQAVTDAMALRTLLLDELPSIRSAVLRGFRASQRENPELIVFGVIDREDPYLLRIPSPVMRAMLCGFRFDLENGFLKTLKTDAHNLPMT